MLDIVIPPRAKFATQIREDLLEALRKTAKMEGRLVQSLVEEAVQSLLEKRQRGGSPLDSMRPHVRQAYLESLEQYAPLYKALAETPPR